MQKAINIQLDQKIIYLAVKSYIQDLIIKKTNSNRYTKFDSENDVLLGVLGEYAFAKFLFNKGLTKKIDYLKIETKNAVEGDKNFVQIGDKFYDKYDFIVSNIRNIQPFRVDVKTQKYIGKPTKDWQFAINSNTIDKINNKTREIDKFVFIFSKLGTEEIVMPSLSKKTPDELKYIIDNNHILNYIKIDSITLEIMGVIDYDKFIFLSSKYEEGEVFRIYEKNGKFLNFTTQSAMYRINLNYLSNPDKIFPYRKIKLEGIDENKVFEIYKNTDLKKPFFQIEINDKLYNCQYDKLYLESRFDTQKEFIQNMCKKNKGN